MHDNNIEDISCDGVHTPLFAFHASYESMKTTLAYHNAEELDSFVTKLAQRSGKYISIAEPILDATMQDGSPYPDDPWPGSDRPWLDVHYP